ncbi:MAG: BolA family protein, partial [Pararhodobacter sp.]
MTEPESVSDLIEQRLRAAFQLRDLTVDDESEQHRGHGGWREGGETHFHVRLAAAELDGLARLARHRAVHEALGPDLIARIH